MHPAHAQLVEISDGLVRFKMQGNTCLDISDVDNAAGLTDWIHYLCMCCEWFDRPHAYALISALDGYKNKPVDLH